MRNIRAAIKWYTWIPAAGGLGTLLFGTFLPYAFPSISRTLALILVYIGAGLMVISVIAAAIKFITFKKTIIITENKNVNQTEDYLHKQLVDIKLPLFKEVTNTLQLMADHQNIYLNRLLERKVKISKMIKIQKTIQAKLDMKPQKVPVGDMAKIKAIVKQVERLHLPLDRFSEEHIKIFLAITWSLDKHGYSLAQFLEQKEYQELDTKLNLQTSKISSNDNSDLILAYKDLVG